MKNTKFQASLLLSLMMVICIPNTSQIKAQTENNSVKSLFEKIDSISVDIQEYQKMEEEAKQLLEELPKEILNESIESLFGKGDSQSEEIPESQKIEEEAKQLLEELPKEILNESIKSLFGKNDSVSEKIQENQKIEEKAKQKLEELQEEILKESIESLFGKNDSQSEEIQEYQKVQKETRQYLEESQKETLNESGIQDKMFGMALGLIGGDSISGEMQEYQKMEEAAKQYLEKSRKEILKESGTQDNMFGITLDLIGGYSSSNSKMEKNINVEGSVPGTSDNGLYAGANVSLNLFGLNFTTGLSFSKKGFKGSNNNTTDMSYFNLPLLFTFPFKVGKIDIEPSVGPSIGLMLSGPSANIDIGLVGSVQGNYMFQEHLGALLGFKYEMTGLKNFGTNENAPNIKTNSWALYTGVRIVF